MLFRSRILDIQMGKSNQWTIGVVTDGTPFIGGLDGVGHAYSWEALGSGKPIPFGNVAFNLGLPDKPGVMAMAGQTIAVPLGNYRTINIAATAVNDSRSAVFTLLYTDGSSESWTQVVSDWTNPRNSNGETKIAKIGRAHV